MKILIITGKDSWNYSLPNIIKALLERNYIIDLYNIYTEFHNVKMFMESDIEFNYCHKLDEEKLEKYDLIFLAECIRANSEIGKMLMYCRKYIFSISNLFHNAYISTVADFIFTSGENNIKYLNHIKYSNSTMAIGNAQYDSLVNDENHINRRILFIDRGYYPFGNEGKIQLAKLLINIAEKYKDYELCIKPRFLIGETKNVTHSNRKHLYTYIKDESQGSIPSNLKLINEHVNLEELINKSDCIMTPYSSCYIEAAIAGKGLIIVDRLPSEEVIEFRHNYIEEIRNRMEGSGCLVHYKEAYQHLPLGIQCSKKHLAKELYDVNNSASRITEIIEFIYKEILNKGYMPSTKNYKYKNYEKEFKGNIDLNWDLLIKNRIINHFLLLKESYRLKLPEVAWERVEDYILELSKLDFLGEKYYFSEFEKIVNKIINKNILENKEKLSKNKISESIYIQTLFSNGLYDQILSMKEQEILCKEAYFFYMGKIKFKNCDYYESIELLNQYLNLAQNKDYIEVLVDYENFILSALYYIGRAYLKIDNKIRALEYFTICKKKSNNQHRMAKYYIDLLRQEI